MANALRSLGAIALLMALTPLTFAQSAKTSASPDRAEVASTAEVINYTTRGFTVYTNEATFDADFPGLPNETFEEATPPGCSAFDGPLNSATNNAWFSPGDILPGLTITTNPTTSPDIFIADTGCFDADSWWIGNNNNTNDLVLQFDPAVNAVGFDVDLDNVGNTTTIEALDAGGNVLGSTTISGTVPTFRGFAGGAIASVVVRTSLSTEWAEVDNIRFGGGGGGECEQSISATLDDPTPSPGQTITFAVTVSNDAASAATLDLWIDASGPANLRRRLARGTLPAGATVTRNVRVRVPGNAPSGAYAVDLNIGDFGSDDICDTASFTVTVSAPRMGAGASDTEWEAAVEGDFFAAASATTAGASAVVAPNPFARQTAISYEVAAASDVRLAVYDVLGREVAVLVDARQEAGAHRATFDASGLAAGTYVYRLVVGNDVQTGRLTLAH